VAEVISLSLPLSSLVDGRDVPVVSPLPGASFYGLGAQGPRMAGFGWMRLARVPAKRR
jgi:hypothetical protein